MKRRLLCPALVALAAAAAPSAAADRDSAFFDAVRGQWSGPGEIIAGKFKGTKFVCTFDGLPSPKMGLTLDGGCRVGVFTQKMSATIERSGGSYRGMFMDGAAGKGLDVIDGDVVDARKVVLTLHRAQLRGAMVAKLADPDTMNISVSVKVEKTMVPVIGVSLKRIDAAQADAAAE